MKEIIILAFIGGILGYIAMEVMYFLLKKLFD